MGKAYEDFGEGVEMSEEKIYYLTRSVPLHEFCFFLEKPTMLILRNGNILWTDAEFVCKIYMIHLVLPMLDVPVGKCWEVMIQTLDAEASVVKVLNWDVDVEKFVR
jgi:hypothetical protein